MNADLQKSAKNQPSSARICIRFQDVGDCTVTGGQSASLGIHPHAGHGPAVAVAANLAREPGFSLDATVLSLPNPCDAGSDLPRGENASELRTLAIRPAGAPAAQLQV